jgi:hypothetical protein
MAVSALAGQFGWAKQNKKSTDVGYVAPTVWKRHRAVSVELGIQDETKVGPPEVGGIAVPTFPYKSGPQVGGRFALQPRLEDTFGELLLALTGGDVVSTETSVGSGIWDHKFIINPAESTKVPWISFRKSVPRKDGAAGTDLGEIYEDCKIVGGTFQFPNDSPIQSQFDVLGREFKLDHAPDAWIWANTNESWESIPVGCQVGGQILINGVELPIVTAQVSWINQPMDPRADRVYGSPFLEDITVIQRVLQYDITVKWNNPDLYATVSTGSNVGTEWTGAPTVSPFKIVAVSSVNMPAETEPYSLTIKADNVMMGQVGGITLAGNNAVMLRYQGTAIEATEYASITLRNPVSGTPGYVWA